MYAALGDDSQQRVERKFKAATGRFHGYWRDEQMPSTLQHAGALSGDASAADCHSVRHH
jgi:hypothetical protein